MTITITRAKRKVACDGIQTVWLPRTPSFRAEVERAVCKSMDGVIPVNVLRDVATYAHRADLQRAVRVPSRKGHTAPLREFTVTMDGVYARRAVVSA